MLLFFLDLSNLATALLLMLGHVPFRDVLLLAVLAHKRPNASVFPQMHFKVGSSVVLFIAAFVLAMELVDIYVRFFMVAQNPLLSKLRLATRVAAHKLLQVLFVVSR